jgi:hypothetical protein
MICIAWKICDEYRYNIQVIFIAYCNSLNKKWILQSIIEILLFILLENFDSQTASYIGSVIGISLQFAKDFTHFMSQTFEAIESWNYMMCFVIWPSFSKSNSEDWEKARLWDHKKSMCLMYFIIFGILQNISPPKRLKSHFRDSRFQNFQGGMAPDPPSMSHAFGVRLMFEKS